MLTPTPTPISHLRITKHFIAAHGLIPNTSLVKKPLLIYHNSLSGFSASQIESHLRSIGTVEPQWRYTMYSTTHFHSTTHEVLCVARGEAILCFGHPQNPDHHSLRIKAGDVLIVPAGVGHQLQEDISGDFEMVGSYPTGSSWDMCYGRAGEEERVAGITKLAWLERDPVYGEVGPVLDV